MTIFRAAGKQVLEGARHYCDARDTDAAQRIAEALNAPAMIDTGTLDPYGNDPEPLDFGEGLAAPVYIEGVTHIERRESDEIVCSCGVRYDHREEHP
jgi:hypothetical protein